jgi:hypothetical protein
MSQLKISNLEFEESLNGNGQKVIGGIADLTASSFSAQVSVSFATKVSLMTNVDFQTRQAQAAYVAGYAGGGAVAASINGRASATVITLVS